MKEMKYDVFFCYNNRDTEIANVIDDYLRDAGISTFFYANQTLPGINFENALVNIINSSRSVIFLCTQNSIQSNWVKNELVYAINSGKTIIPVIVDHTKLPADIDYLIGKYQQLHISTASLMADIKHIASKLVGFLRSISQQASKEETPSIDQGITESYSASAAEPSENKTKSKTGINFKSILSVILYIVGGIVGIIYLVALSIAFDSGNISEAISLLAPIVFGAIALILLNASARKYDLKLYCTAEDDTESTLRVTVDDKVISLVRGKGMVRLRERKGEYLISIDSGNPEVVSERFTYRFCKENHGEIKEVTLKKKKTKPTEKQSESASNITPFRCFIAGSTRLVNERNATRAVLSVLYNKWESHNLVISSYTFEDFSNSYTIGGQQIQYNEFIKDKADCAIFIVTENVGDKTLEEYRLAVETFKSNHKRPKIFVYANNLGDSDITKQFIEEVRKNNSYWRDYSNIKDLMNLVKDDVDSELFNIFVLNKGLLK